MGYSMVGEISPSQAHFNARRGHKMGGRAGLLGAWLLLVCLQSAQAAPGFCDVHGLTRNSQGTPLPGAEVRLHSLEDDTDRSILSDDHGFFLVEQVKPGRYELRARQEGLASSPVTTVTLLPHQDLRVDLTLSTKIPGQGAAGPGLTADSRSPVANAAPAEPHLTDRERMLLERLDRLEQRLEAMEAKAAKTADETASARPPVAASANNHEAVTATTRIPPAPAAPQASAGTTTVGGAQPAPAAAVGPKSATAVAPPKHVLLASLEGAIGLKPTERASAPRILPDGQGAVAAKAAQGTSPATPAQHVLPEALEGPDSGPDPKSVTVYNWADYTWLNGTPRNKDTVLDTKFFTPEIRFDTHFMEDFNQPIDHTMGGATESFRSGEIQVEQISVGGDFHWQNVRGRILAMDGLFATTTPRNDASAGVGQWDVRGAYKYVSEAYGGYHFNVNHGLNVDAGIFVSYIGLFSYYNFDNWAYQPSYVSSNTPWFFNGLRIQWFPTSKLKIEPWLINGWQSYNRYNGHMGLGGQILYRPAEWLSLVFNQYGYGEDNLGLPNVQRIHTDDSIEVRYYNRPKSNRISKAAFSLTGDLGCQYGPGFRCTGGATKDSFAGWMLYNRVWWGHDKYAITYGGGKMNNPGRYLTLLPPINGADAISGSPYFTENPGQAAHMWDTTLTFQWMPKQYITWWLEAGHRHSDVPYFTGRGGITPPGGNTNAPNYYVCSGGGSAGSSDLATAEANCGGGPGSVWFPDLRRSQDVVSAGIMVKF